MGNKIMIGHRNNKTDDNKNTDKYYLLSLCHECPYGNVSILRKFWKVLPRFELTGYTLLFLTILVPSRYESHELYFKHGHQLQAHIRKSMDIQNLASPNDPPTWKFPIFIYGTGTIGMDIWKLLSTKGFSVKGFIDHRGVQPPPMDANTYLPGDERLSMDERKNSTVIIAIHNRDANIPLIIQNLRVLE